MGGAGGAGASGVVGFNGAAAKSSGKWRSMISTLPGGVKLQWGRR